MEILREFLDVIKSHDGDGIEPDAKRARTGAYSGSIREKPPNVTKCQEEEPIAQEEKEARAGEGEEQTSKVEVQGTTDDDGVTRNGLEVDNAATGGDSVVGDQGSALNRSSAAETKQQEFHLVKLARNGMVYISISSRPPGDLVTFFAKILKDFHTRSRAAPRWCHRIFPVQATCVWSKEDVRSNVAVLVKEFIEGHSISSNNPLKYAVAVNRRGLDEKERTGDAAASTVSFGKLECIHAVTEAIQSLTPHISVDLTNPQMVVILEVLPLVRVETSVCAVSVFPRELVVTKPKLVIQALAPPKKQKEKKH